MSNIPDHIDDLIASYFAGEATPEQVEAVERWRKESEENSRYFNQIGLIFQKAASFRETIPFDADEAWNRLRERLTEKKTIPITRHDTGVPWLKIAAGVVFLITVGLFTYQFFSSSDVYQSKQIVADTGTVSDTLPEGSNVFLNKKSHIEYQFDKSSDAHVARLSGEAYFDIQHEPEKLFLVEAGETFIKDIGTSFNVKAYPESNTIEVLVEDGEVLFYTKDNPGIHLKAHDRGIYDRTTGKFSEVDPEPNVTAYKTKSFNFSNYSLESVVKKLNEVYDRRVVIDENLRSCRLTVSFEEENIEEIVHVIGETLNLSVEVEKDTIRLTGAGCGEAQGK